MKLRAANLHELTRDLLAEARKLHPERLVDIEHRGDGDCEIDAHSFAVVVAGILSWALAASSDDPSVWIRSSGTDAAVLTVDVRWTGAPQADDAWDLSLRAALGADMTLERSSDGRERRVRLALPRFA